MIEDDLQALLADDRCRDKNLFDFDEAIKRCACEPTLFRKMVDFFFQESDALLPLMRVAMEEGRFKDMAAAAHRYRGTLVYLAAARALAAVIRVEEIGGAGTDGLAVAVKHMEEEIGQLKQVLRPHRTVIA